MRPARPVKIVIAGGGTGGHVLPAISVIEELRRRDIRVDPLWIGSRNGVECTAAASTGIRFVPVRTGKLRRYLDLQTIADAVRIPIGAVQAWSLLRRFRPDVIFSTGGFVSVPSVIAGSRIAPILTHEQTTILGLATRINARFADVLALSYESTRTLATGVKSRIVVTGNPVRLSLLTGDAIRGRERFGFAPDMPLLYITGGARGASPLNQRIEKLLPELLETCQILHQAGPAAAHDDAARLQALRATWPEHLQARYRVVEFVGEEIADVYAAASLVLGRAGAGTVAELALLGKPSILIPLPLSGGGEQDVNARMLGDAGAAVVLAETDADPARLRAEIESLMQDPTRLAGMSAKAGALCRPDAASRLVDELLSLIG